MCCKAANGSKSKHWSVCFNAQNLALNWRMRRKIYKYVNFISCEYLMPCRLNKTKRRVSSSKVAHSKTVGKRDPVAFPMWWRVKWESKIGKVWRCNEGILCEIDWVDEQINHLHEFMCYKRRSHTKVMHTAISCESAIKSGL